MPFETNMRAVIYARVSTEQQSEGSIEEQIRRCKQYCELKGYTVVAEYTDVGSGMKTDRPQFEIMMSNMNEWDICVAYKLDRFHRSSGNASAWAADLNNQGKNFAAIDIDIDTSSAMGLFIFRLMTSLAQLEVEQTRERTKMGWDAIVHGVGEESELLASEAVAQQYREDRSDEFMPALIFHEASTQRVRDGDVVIVFNFRADRARQLSEVFLSKEFDGFEAGERPDVHYVTLTEYDETYDCSVVFPSEKMTNVLGQVVSAAGKSQLRIAETEKYPHVTYFFNGGEEEPCEEERKNNPH